MELISLKDFILQLGNEPSEYASNFDKAYAYAKFLSRPLTLGMFVPCVDDEPFNYSKHGNEAEFKAAKDKVLFEGFRFQINKWGIDFYVDDHSSGKSVQYGVSYDFKDDCFLPPDYAKENTYETVEEIIYMNLTLTPTAITSIF